MRIGEINFYVLYLIIISNNKFMKKIFFILPVAVLLAAGCNKQSNTDTNTVNHSTMQEQMNQTSSTMPSMKPETNLVVTSTTDSTKTPADSSVKSFTVVGKNFSFSPNSLTVKKGDTVKITFQNADGFHNLLIDNFKVKSASIPSGKSTNVQFIADKTGSFKFYCSVGNHRVMGMYGTLIVQ